MNDNEILKKAVSAVYEKELDEYVGNTECDEHIFSPEFEKKMDKLVSRRRKPYYNFVRTIGRRAAWAACFAAILCVSSLSIKAVRENVFSLFTHEMSNNNEIVAAIDDDDSSPETIEKYYGIVVPDGYTLYESNELAVTCFYTYENEAGDYINFTQTARSSFKTSVDNERSEIEHYTDDNGQNYIIYTWKEDNRVRQTLVIWDNGEYVFDVMACTDRDTTMAIVNSMHEK